MPDSFTDLSHHELVKTAGILTLHLLDEADVSEELDGERQWPPIRRVVAGDIEQVLEDPSAATAKELTTATNELRETELDFPDEVEMMRIGSGGRAQWDIDSEKWLACRNDAVELASQMSKAALHQSEARAAVENLTERVGPGWEDVVANSYYTKATTDPS